MSDLKRQEKEAKQAVSFSKEQFLASKQFSDQKDLLDALLLPNQCYSVAEVEKMIENYKKREVK